jgi:hypothetical protein
VVDSYWARLIIRRRIQDRRLPSGRAIDVLDGIGDGRPCDACADVIRPDQPAVRAIISFDWLSVRFHAECFEIWDLERFSARQQKQSAAHTA